MLRLFPNAKISKNHIQDLLSANLASDSTQAAKAYAQSFSCQRQVHVSVLMILTQGLEALLQVSPMAGLSQTWGSDQRICTP